MCLTSERVNDVGFFFKSKEKDITINSENITLLQAENSIRIIQDSAQIIQETENPDTFFSRLCLFRGELNKLKAYQGKVKLSVDPDEIISAFERDKQNIIHSLIVRYYNRTCEEASKLKSNSAKIRRFQKFVNSFESYSTHIDEYNANYIKHKYKSAIDKISET